ncbi:MAG: VWA domain-containing protein [Solirubrobacterales bacterium]
MSPGPGPFGSVPEAGPPGLTARLLELVGALREEGLRVGTSEILDALEATSSVTWSSETAFREALAATLAKSPEDRRVFDLVFGRFFFRAAEAEAIRQDLAATEAEAGATPGDEQDIDLEALAQAVREAVAEGTDPQMRDLARLAVAALGRQGEGVGVVGVDVQRIRRALGLQTHAGRRDDEPDPDEGPTLDRESINAFERHLRRELERRLIERTGTLPPARPLADLDRALPSNPAQDLAAVHRSVKMLKRRLATVGHEHRGRRHSSVVDVRRTMRTALETGGVPLRLRYRPRRPRRPEIFVLCDVSTSVTSASLFFLSVLHALHDAFRKLRSFVFIERISEVTEVFARERDFTEISRKISSDGGVADVSGYTDYGRVWLEFGEQVARDLGPRSTIIVLGDARTNGRAPHAPALGAVTARAGRTFWLNPEPRLYWNYGDSVISAYEPFVDGVFECWTTQHLEQFVGLLAGQAPEPQPR